VKPPLGIALGGEVVDQAMIERAAVEVEADRALAEARRVGDVIDILERFELKSGLCFYFLV
jgi:hypothetical protein